MARVGRLYAELTVLAQLARTHGCLCFAWNTAMTPCRPGLYKLRGPGGETALHLAAQGGNEIVVGALLLAGGAGSPAETTRDPRLRLGCAEMRLQHMHKSTSCARAFKIVPPTTCRKARSSLFQRGARAAAAKDATARVRHPPAH